LLREEFDAFWIPWCMDRTKREIVQRLQAGGLPCAPVNSIADLASDPHLHVRGYFQSLSHPVAGTAQYPGLPFVMHETPGAIWKAAPLLGEDNEVVYGELGYAPHDLARLASAGVV